MQFFECIGWDNLFVILVISIQHRGINHGFDGVITNTKSKEDEKF